MMKKTKQMSLINDILSKDEKWQYIIPIYQRKYQWTFDNCKSLLETIYNFDNDEDELFIGFITEQQEDDDKRNYKFYLIDGQQRITTILLILKVLQLIIFNPLINKEENFVDINNEISQILWVNHEPRLIYEDDEDNDNFLSILNKSSIQDIKRDDFLKNKRITNNFIYLYESLYKTISNKEKTLNSIFDNLKLLWIWEAVLKPEQNAQKIFESINALGVKLKDSDCIKNYLLINNKQSYKLWKSIEEELITEKYLEQFIRHYLISKLHKKIDNKNIYNQYIQFAKSSKTNFSITNEDLMKDLYESALIYQVFLRRNINYSNNINNLLHEITILKSTIFYPFLLNIFSDFKKGELNEEELAKIINLLIVWIVRRNICNLSSNSLTEFACTLYKNLFIKFASNKQCYYAAIYKIINELTGNKKLPSLLDTKSNLEVLDLYHGDKDFCKYLLFTIENKRYLHKSKITINENYDEMTIEHLMPQTLNDEWIQKLGPNYEQIHEQYLNTIANLTLIDKRNNSIMSNNIIEVKNETFQSSQYKFKTLDNIELLLEKFNRNYELALKNRMEILSDEIIKNYDLQNIDTSNVVLNNYEIFTVKDKSDITNEENEKDIDFFTNKKGLLFFEIFNHKYDQNIKSFVSILIQLTKIVYDKDPNLFLQKQETLEKCGIYINKNKQENKEIWESYNEVLQGIELKTSPLSGAEILKRCLKLLKLLAPNEELKLGFKID